jgi:hypothetical protein
VNYKILLVLFLELSLKNTASALNLNHAFDETNRTLIINNPGTNETLGNQIIYQIIRVNSSLKLESSQFSAQCIGNFGQIGLASTSKDSDLLRIQVNVSPSKPTIDDNGSLKVELTYPTAGYIVEFGEVTIKDKVISIDIKTRPPSGIAAQVITTYSHEYNLGYFSEGSYIFLVSLNSILTDNGSFEVLPIKSQEITPVSIPSENATKRQVKTPGFTLPIELILIDYIVLKIKSGVYEKYI